MIWISFEDQYFIQLVTAKSRLFSRLFVVWEGGLMTARNAVIIAATQIRSDHESTNDCGLCFENDIKHLFDA